MSRSGFIEFEAAIAVARFRNFRAAAADLGMSPTALSSTIRGLEARIGVQIFSRTTRSVALTAAGNAFIERISSSLADINEAIRIAQGHAILYPGIIFDFLKVWKRWERKVSRA